MTKDEYMEALKNNIQALTIDEQKEALQYYNDYFDDAGFDEEKVLKELGTPEQVAQTIIQNFANTLVKTGSSENTDKTEDAKSESSENSNVNGIYYEFKKDAVKNLELSFGAAEIIVIPGKTFGVETRGLTKENLLCRIDTNDTLVVKNLNKLQSLNLFKGDRKNKIAPRILLTIPVDTKLEKLKISLGAGRFETKELSLSCNTGFIETGAGNMVINGLSGNNMNIRCGMGNTHITGKITGKTNIDCGMGSIKIECPGNTADYSYDAKVGLGDVKFNDEKRSGVVQYFADSKKANHFSVNCGMGSVTIVIK